MPAGLRQPGKQREVIVETGTTLSVDHTFAGKTVCNVGAGGALTATLTSAATGWKPGDDVLFLSCADQNFTVAGTAGQLITFNDIAANSVALSTASEKCGGALLVTCVSGTKFHVALMTEETQTATVAT
jgi:hypothetical protein